MDLTQEERTRYLKQIQLSQIGEAGQLLLKQASVLVVGAGGLGSPVLAYLAAAGVGRLAIVDPDRVSLSNLQRQVIHDTPSLGYLKVDSAAERIHKVNPNIQVEKYPVFFNPVNAPDLVSGRSVVVDCTDNLDARLLINETCVTQGVPFVYGAVFEYEGQVSVFDARRGPCLRCMIPQLPAPQAIPDPGQHGLLGMLPGLIGVLQATEVIKLLLGLGDPLIGRLLVADLLTTRFMLVNLHKRAECPVCGRLNTGSQY